MDRLRNSEKVIDVAKKFSMNEAAGICTSMSTGRNGKSINNMVRRPKLKTYSNRHQYHNQQGLEDI